MIDSLIKIAAKVIDKIIPDKTEAENVKIEFAKTLTEIYLKERESIQNFALEYEGRAERVPKFILIMRALIRPFFTWLFGLVGAAWTIGYGLGLIEKPLPKSINIWVIIVLSFWFGGRVYEKAKGIK